MFEFAVSPELVAGIAGAILSLVFSYVPGLNVRFAALLPEVKRLIMAGLLLGTSAVIFVGTCYGWLTTDIQCDQAGIIRLVSVFLTAVIANQSTFQITPKTKSVKIAGGKITD